MLLSEFEAVMRAPIARSTTVATAAGTNDLFSPVAPMFEWFGRMGLDTRSVLARMILLRVLCFPEKRRYKAPKPLSSTQFSRNKILRFE